MGNQHDPLDPVHGQQEPQLFDDSVLFTERFKVPGQTSGTSGHGQPVVAWQAKTGMQQLIDLFAESTIAAIHGDGVNPA